MRRVLAVLVIAILLAAPVYSQQPANKKSLSFHNLGEKINSPYDEFSPTLTADGRTLVFSSYSGTKYIDLFISERTAKQWSTPRPMTELNSPYNDETPFITPDGKWLFFASDRDGSAELPRDERGIVRVSFDIYYSQRRPDGTWEKPAPIPGYVNNGLHQKTPAISHDGRYLFYSQWEFGKIEESTVYASELADGSFGEPFPLPKIINSGHQDVALTPGKENHSYFFSSRRPGGLGGWDIYKTYLIDGKWTEPENAGPEINTSLHEIYYSDRGKIHFLCSNRLGGLGNYDIYSSELFDVGSKAEFTVVDKKTKRPLPNTIVTIQADTPYGKISINKKTDTRGRFEIIFDKDLQNLAFSVNRADFLPLIKNLETDKIKREGNILPLARAESGASFEIEEIYFDSNSDTIKPDSEFYLQQLAGFLKQNRSIHLAIIGHTDLHGTELFNLDLSERRARSVVRYLTESGLDAKRFQVEGRGESQPKVAATGPEVDAKNRRTEFKILRK